MAVTQKVVTDRRLKQYHELLTDKISEDIQEAIDSLATVAKTGKIDDLIQNNTIIFYGGSATDLIDIEQEEGT